MYVVNFDFSSSILPVELLTINLPVILTQCITYPFQRIQTLMIAAKQNITKNQFNQFRYTLRHMWGTEGFPKMLHGMRYSMDYTGTMMTSKFLMFDFLMSKILKGNIDHASRYLIMANCYIANAFSTAMAQIAFNYQILASSLPVDKSNRPQNVRNKLMSFTSKHKFPIYGLNYTIPVSILNTTVELAVLNRFNGIVSRMSTLDNSYVIQDLLAAFIIFTLTSFPTHYAFQRQVQITLNLKPKSINFTKGLLATIFRQNFKGLLLFSCYLAYFQYHTKKQFQSIMAVRRQKSSSPMPYRQ